MCSVQKIGNVFLLTITGVGEHRLNPTLIRSIRSALQRIKSDAVSSSALVTTNEGKFFSNGYDLDWALTDSNEDKESKAKTMTGEFMSLISDLISFPMPTIAAVTGHASAAGFVLAAAHDYVIMRKERGFLYMSEVDIDLVVPEWFVEVVRSKIGSGVSLRDVFLKAEKLTGTAAMEMGLVDEVVEGAEMTVARGVKFGEELIARKWKGHVYASNRLIVLSGVVQAIDIAKGRVGISRL